MAHGLRVTITLLIATAILSLWLWGVMSLIRHRNRTVGEREVLGGTMRTARSGPMFSATWAPNTGPAYLFTSLMYGIGYIAFTVFDFFPVMVAIFSILAAATYIPQMRRKIGLGNRYARAAVAVYLVTVIISVGGYILRYLD